MQKKGKVEKKVTRTGKYTTKRKLGYVYLGKRRGWKSAEVRATKGVRFLDREVIR